MGQLRIGQGLAFTIDSMSVYSSRAQDEYFAVKRYPDLFFNGENGLIRAKAIFKYILMQKN